MSARRSANHRQERANNRCPHPEWHTQTPRDTTGLVVHPCPACNQPRIWKTS